MASAAVAIPSPHGSATTGPTVGEQPPHIVRLWGESTRVEQLARLKALELQPGDEYGLQAWQQAQEIHRNLPKRVRIDLPSPRVFGRVLGFFRTGATLKTGKLLRLEISVQEMAHLLGYSKATVEACLRWLGSEPIEYQGEIIARGLGIIHRGRRTAWAFLDGVRRRVYRTSRLVLTLIGRLLLGLGEREQERKKERREQRRRQQQEQQKQEASVAAVEVRPEPHHVQGQDDAGAAESDADHDVSKSWLRKIRESLG